MPPRFTITLSLRMGWYSIFGRGNLCDIIVDAEDLTKIEGCSAKGRSRWMNTMLCELSRLFCALIISLGIFSFHHHHRLII